MWDLHLRFPFSGILAPQVLAALVALTSSLCVCNTAEIWLWCCYCNAVQGPEPSLLFCLLAPWLLMDEPVWNSGRAWLTHPAIPSLFQHLGPLKQSFCIDCFPTLSNSLWKVYLIAYEISNSLWKVYLALVVVLSGRIWLL